MAGYDLLIVNLSEIVSADPALETPDDPLGRILNGALGIAHGCLAFVGPEAALPREARRDAQRVIDAKRAVAFPGFIDGHTHLVFAGTREDEFARRVAGMPYMQIAAEGGGILSTVRATRAATEGELYGRARHWLDEMLRWGTTTIEAKSGYGLETETELKQLRVIRRLDRDHAMEITPTFLGAHEFPPEYRDRREAYVDLVVEEMLPAVADEGLARFCDVFCEAGVFTVAQARRILEAGMARGLLPRFHADEFADTGGAALAADLGAPAADHLMAANPAHVPAMREAGVCAALLPATSYYLGNQKYADARMFLAGGVAVALATDFNPGSSVVCNLPFVANLGMTQLRMTFAEAVLAITRHAARSLRLDDRLGSLAVGMQADVAIMDIPRPEYFAYHVGRNHAWKVVKQGRVVYENPTSPVFLG